MSTNTIITVYSEERGVEFLDAVMEDIVLKLGTDYTIDWDKVLEKYMISYLYNIMHGNVVIKNKNGKEGIIDLSGDIILECQYNKIVPINREYNVYETWSDTDKTLIYFDKVYDPDRYIIYEVIGPNILFQGSDDSWIEDLRGVLSQPSQAKLLNQQDEYYRNITKQSIY